MSSSLVGNSARRSTIGSSKKLPSTIAPLTTKRCSPGLPVGFLYKAFARMDGSVLPSPMAVICVNRDSGNVRPTSFMARSRRVFLTTTYSIPVSYTHLRAHETRHDLVCRLLLEKKKKKKKKKKK